MKTSIVCMAKDEDHYIDEWIDYHHSLGFDDFYIYRDNWDGMTEMMKKDFCHVYDVKDFIDNWQIEEQDLKQDELYGKVLDKIIDQYDFAAVIDCDEFINLRQHRNIKEFLENYVDVQVIVMNWYLFGDSHLSSVQDGNYSCINRFVYRAKNIHCCVKSIYNLKEISKADIKLSGLVGIHHVKDFSKLNVCTLDKTRCTTGTMQENKVSSAKIAYINHYGVKTLEEYRKKYERNFMCRWEKNNRWKYNGVEGRFQAGNWNAVFDDSLKNRYAEMKSQDDNASIIEH